MPTRRSYHALVLLFYFCFFTFMSSGRLSGGDPGAQFQSALLVARTGSPASATQINGSRLWAVKRHGRYYQCHDVGNLVLMLPAACLGAALSHASTAALCALPPAYAKILVALTYAAVCAVGLFFLFRTFALLHPERTAFLLSLAFAATTLFLAYAKSAFDVVGACSFVCLLLYFAARLLRGEVSPKHCVGAGLALAAACSFRFSLAPFLLLGLVGVLLLSRCSLHPKHWAWCLGSFAAGLLPALLYNFVRMGSPFVPATTAPIYVAMGTADLSGNFFAGLYGLLCSPKKGLVFFSPLFLLLLALPFTWSRLPLLSRQLLVPLGSAALLHLCLLAKLRGWDSFGWGPRYLLSILPILFLGVAGALTVLWEKRRRPLIALLGASFLLSLPPALVNWHLAINTFSQAQDPSLAQPTQQEAVWHGLALGLRGRPLPTPPPTPGGSFQPISARFPDLWTIKLMQQSRLQHSRSGFAAGLLLSLLLTTGALGAFRALLQTHTEGGAPFSLEKEAVVSSR